MRWNQRGPSERIPPVCNYCELTYGARTRGARPGTRGAFRDRRLATQVMALAEALECEARQSIWRHQYGRS